MSKQIEYIFKLFDKWVTVSTNEQGSTLYITYDDYVIEDSSGDCVSWPKYMNGLHGAALEAATNLTLKNIAESAIAQTLENHLTNLNCRPE